MNLGHTADGVTTRGCESKGVDNKGGDTGTSGSVIARGVLTCERLRSEISLLFHSHAMLPVMARPTPETRDDS